MSQPVQSFDSFSSPRAHYHLRDGRQLVLPSRVEGAARIVGGFVPSAVADDLLKGENYHSVPFPGVPNSAAASVWLMDYAKSDYRDADNEGQYHEVVIALFVVPASASQCGESCFPLSPAPSHSDPWFGSGYAFLVRLWLDREYPITAGREVYGFNKDKQIHNIATSNKDGAFQFIARSSVDQSLLCSLTHGPLASPSKSSTLVNPLCVSGRTVFPRITPMLVESGTYDIYTADQFTFAGGEYLQALQFAPAFLVHAENCRMLVEAHNAMVKNI